NDIGIGAVGTAIIAGLVSLLGLIIGKEQKVSEFRQAWIDDLRKCLVAYLVNINAIADAVRVSIASKMPVKDISENYKLLNEANHGIILRVNYDEQPTKNLIAAMDEFQVIASRNANLTVENIKVAEIKYIDASKELLKFEWKRVKRGEKTYFITKYIVIALIVLMMILFAYLWYSRSPDKPVAATFSNGATTGVNQMVCQVRNEYGTDAHTRRAKVRKSIKAHGRQRAEIANGVGKSVCDVHDMLRSEALTNRSM
ncbi:hypothetical protein DBR17_13935, partial [Sphingomonas sp. HMWF008]